MQYISEKKKDYISASIAAKKSGYTSDYIGQLCRSKKIPGELIGRMWYLDYSALQAHKKAASATPRGKGIVRSSEKLSIQAEQGNWIASPILERMRSNLLHESDFPARPLTYSTEEFPLFPSLSKKEKYSPPVWTLHLTREISLVTLSLIFAISLGFSVLQITEPKLAQELRSRTGGLSSQAELALLRLPGEISSGSQVVAISFSDFLSDSAQNIARGFDMVRDAVAEHFVPNAEVNTLR